MDTPDTSTTIPDDYATTTTITANVAVPMPDDNAPRWVPVPPRCGTCQWFRAPVPDDESVPMGLPEGWAQCRRNPPQRAGFPVVHETMDCGEHSPRSVQP